MSAVGQDDELDELIDEYAVVVRDAWCGCAGVCDDEYLSVPVDDVKDLIKRSIILLDGGDPHD